MHSALQAALSTGAYQHYDIGTGQGTSMDTVYK